MLEGLADNNVRIVEVNASHVPRVFRPLWLMIHFFRHGLKSDAIVVSEAGHKYVPIAKFMGMAFRKPVLFDAMLSHYYVVVEELKRIKKRSMQAKIEYLTEKLAYLLADRVFMDSKEHAKYIERTFNVHKHKISPVYVGADEILFSQAPLPPAGKEFRVLFFGTFYPTHGVEFILAAANILQEHCEIVFDIYGDGPLRPHMEEIAASQGLRNVFFRGWALFEDLPRIIAESHVCLGVFGKTPMVDWVVPGKLFQALAVGRPVITADSAAVREIFEHKQHCYLVPRGDPVRLAQAILELRDDEDLRNRLAQKGRQRFLEVASRKAVGMRVRRIIEEVL